MISRASCLDAIGPELVPLETSRECCSCYQDQRVENHDLTLSLGINCDNGVLTVMYVEPLCSFKVLSVGGLMEARWRRRRKKKAAGMPSGSGRKAFRERATHKNGARRRRYLSVLLLSTPTCSIRFEIVTHKHFHNFLIPSIHTASHDRSTGNIFLTCTRLRMCAAGIRVLIMIWHVFPDLYLLNTILNVFKQPASIDWDQFEVWAFPRSKKKTK